MVASVAAVTLVAIVAEDQTPLRAAPRADAPLQATLWEGDWLEVRGEQAEYLKVWDHRRERPGFVRHDRARLYQLDAATAPALRSVVRFLRDSAGHESLGIAHAALFLRAAPAGPYPDVQAELGLMADRLARRVSRRGNTADAAHLDVARHYGVGFLTLEGEGRARTCYDGEALRAALGASDLSPRLQVESALALTCGECTDPGTAPSLLAKWQQWRLDVLERTEKLEVAPHLQARVRLRRIEALAYLAWQSHRTGVEAEGSRLAAAALKQLALVDRSLLADDDSASYQRALLQAASMRWAAETSKASVSKSGLRVVVKTGAPGESCLQLFGKSETPLFQRCTYGQVWTRSFLASTRGDRAVIAVQPLPGWSELWVMRQGAEGWNADVLTPATAQPELGYVESAGFSPDGERLLVVREARLDNGRFERRFQVLRASTPELKIELQARTPRVLHAFRRFASPAWRSDTLSLRGEAL